ncbi:hypothetical protein Nepgr_006599 [Nepenthes gracilis]|uniref:Uncharacterized protein n=1 Tax=Nepenthes gracilis TaxID=150966 RepID=A0AAD3S5C9_NEPGR|nr:hypothetical protein Nepgr_006599 [Nepenthes gracilis]
MAKAKFKFETLDEDITNRLQYLLSISLSLGFCLAPGGAAAGAAGLTVSSAFEVGCWPAWMGSAHPTVPSASTHTPLAGSGNKCCCSLRSISLVALEPETSAVAIPLAPVDGSSPSDAIPGVVQMGWCSAPDETSSSGLGLVQVYLVAETNPEPPAVGFADASSINVQIDDGSTSHKTHEALSAQQDKGPDWAHFALDSSSCDLDQIDGSHDPRPSGGDCLTNYVGLDITSNSIARLSHKYCLDDFARVEPVIVSPRGSFDGGQ